MSRRRRAKIRAITPDSRYGDATLGKFIRCVMIGGKFSTASAFVYEALDQLSSKVGVSQIDAFYKVLENVSPKLEVRSKRVGGATYQVPVEVSPRRQTALAIRWLISFARKKSGMSMAQRLCNEMTDAYNARGAAVKKREDVHKMAESNKAFSHLRF